MNTRRSAFTLVELLAVIAIVGVLAAIVITSVGRVRETARGQTCLNNLRQIAAGMMLYAADNKGVLPASNTSTSINDQRTLWGYALWLYIYGDVNSFRQNFVGGAPNSLIMGSPVYEGITENVFRCPSTMLDLNGLPGTTPLASRFSYGYNTGSNDTADRTRAIRLNTIATPARTVAVVESSAPYGYRNAYLSYWGLAPHRGAANFLFFDGHVRSLRVSEVPTSSEDPFWRY